MSVSRRVVLKTGATALAASALPTSMGLSPVWAKSALTMGAITIDVLSDGNLKLPVRGVIPDAPEKELAALLQKYNLSMDGLEPDCNLTLYRDGTNTVLFDVGSGPNFMPSAGKLSAAMEEFGLDPSEVTHVVFTHAHPDHLWGLMDDFDEPVFSEAKYLISKTEWDFWIDPTTVEKMNEARKTFAVGAKRNLEGIEDKITRFNFGEEILPGVQALDTHGHTPGHTSFEIRSASESVIVTGDAITNHAVSFEKPGWRSGSDQDGDQGIKTRKMLLDGMASEKMRMVGFHLPYPGIGYAEKANGAYRFVAA